MKKRLLSLMTLALLLAAMPALAQNVSVSPASGYLLAANTEGLDYTEVGWQQGWRSLWRHHQLPLTMMVADRADLTSGEELQKPAGNIVVDYQNDATRKVGLTSAAAGSVQRLVIQGGSGVDCYISVSLPKGYRITGYRLVMLNNCNNQTIHTSKEAAVAKTVYETDKTFETTRALATSGTMGSTDEWNKEYVVERTSMSGGADMRNHLFFRVQRGANNFFAFTIKSFVIYFTAEGPVDFDVAPSAVNVTAVNHDKATFETGRPAVGQLTPQTTQSGETLYAYMATAVHSLTADNIIYQEDAVAADGTLTESPGHITERYNRGHFRYGLKNDTYYVESPTEAVNASGKTLPLGLRITGAKIHYTYGNHLNEENAMRHTVSFERNGTTYYLNAQGRFTTDHEQGVLVEKELKSGDDYYLSFMDGNTKRYLSYSQSGLWLSTTYTLTITTSKDKAFKQDAQGHIYFTTQSISVTTENYLDGSVSDAPTFTTSSNSSTLAVRPGTYVAGYDPAPYTLSVYGADGTTVTQTVSVTQDTEDGFVELTGLNNDAVKFQIAGLEDNADGALIYVTLTVEALNPYVDRMRVVCHNSQTTGVGSEMAQVFNVDDFQMKGGKFTFYVPTSFYNDADTQGLQFYFDNLYSKYGDNTYYDNTTNGRSRYYFLKSAYDTNGQHAADAAYTDKVLTMQCGTQKFVANNLGDLGPTGSTSAETKVFEEYQFSDALYQQQGGQFEQLYLARDGEQTRMVVVADEARYNIGKLAGDHVAYAYYDMDIELKVKDYDAVGTWTKIYDATCYVDGNGEEKHDAMYGLSLSAQDAGQPTKGYLTYSQLQTILDRDVTSVSNDGTKPTELSQILYIDASGLDDLTYNKPEAGQDNQLVALRKRLAKNALVFLPANTASTSDNFARQIDGTSFRASNNIVLTDRQPFFTPYTISLNASNKALYTRAITWQTNGKVTKATLLLPFALDMESGEHRNSDGTAFRLWQMTPENCISELTDDTQRWANYFDKARREGVSGTLSAANKPYMVEVTEAPADENASFAVEQTGATIVATPHDGAQSYTQEGESGTGTLASGNVTLTNLGTFAGQKLSKSGAAYFYFGNNMLLNSQYISEKDPFLYVYPFRAYFATEQAAAARCIRQMEIVFGENPNATPTGVTQATAPTALTVTPGTGTLTVTAAEATAVSIATPAGLTAARLALACGESATVTLPKGIYVVQGRKVIVR